MLINYETFQLQALKHVCTGTRRESHCCPHPKLCDCREIQREQCLLDRESTRIFRVFACSHPMSETLAGRPALPLLHQYQQRLQLLLGQRAQSRQRAQTGAGRELSAAREQRWDRCSALPSLSLKAISQKFNASISVTLLFPTGLG